MRGLAIALVLGGGMLLAGSAAADWTAHEGVREVGDVPIAEVETTPGTELAPFALRNGLVAVGAGLLLLALRGVPKRVLGGLVALLGAGTAAWLVPAWTTAAAQPGDVTAAAGLAGLGALVTTAGGVLAAVRPGPAPRLGARYTVDEPAGDHEWEAATEDEPPTMNA